MADAAQLAEEILNDVNLIVDLYSKISTNIAQAKDLIAGDPTGTATQQIAEAKLKLASIQSQATQADADFDAALAASQE